jgi:hypothetical protein
MIALLLSGTAVSAQMTSTRPRLTPQQAADILRPNQFKPAPATGDGPVFVVVGKPGALSWLEFPPEIPRRRLDGTLLDSNPPDHYWQPQPPLVVVTPRSRR